MENLRTDMAFIDNSEVLRLKLVESLFLFLLVIVGLFLSGLSLYWTWNWFAVPFLGVPALGFWQCWALKLVAQSVRISTSMSAKIEENDVLTKEEKEKRHRKLVFKLVNAHMYILISALILHFLIL